MITLSVKPDSKDFSLLEEAVGYLNFSSGASDPKFLRTINALFESIEPRCDDTQQPLAVLCVWLEQRMNDLSANAQAFEQRMVHEFLPALRQRLVLERAIDPQRLPLRDLLLLCEQRRLRFLRETYVEAEQVNVAADFFARAVRTMAGKQRQDAAALLHDGVGNAREGQMIAPGAVQSPIGIL